MFATLWFFKVLPRSTHRLFGGTFPARNSEPHSVLGKGIRVVEVGEVVAPSWKEPQVPQEAGISAS